MELPDPKPSPDQYLIEVHASAANFFDILQIQGKYQNQPRKHLHVAIGVFAISVSHANTRSPL